jgi:1,5-anhydro-D-fructose reductase (1,5-anhydro-D-mannitol-forming)
MINTGIIGFGKMGRIREHAVQGCEHAQVIMVFDPIAQDIDYPTAGTVDEVINHEGIDAIFVCTPNYLNKELTIRSLQAGKHVFCEKPPAFTAADVKEIQAVENATGKVLMYGFNHRHHSSIKHMKQLIDSHDYGKILWMRGRYGKSVDETYYDNWRAKRKLAGGGILIDQGIHMLDLFIHLGGSFDSIQAVVSNLYWNLDVEDNVFATLQNTKTGMVAALHSTMTQWRHLFSLEIFLEKGYMTLNGLKTSSNSYGDEILSIAKNRSTAPAATWEDEERITYHEDSSWDSEILEFFSAIEQNRKVKIGNSNDAVKLMNLIDRIYNTQKENK